MSSSEQQRLQDEIAELRGELGETVEALVHKVDVPARAKERGNELAEQAVERGIQVVDRGSEFGGRLLEWCTRFQSRVAERSSEMRDQALDTAERARETASQTPADRWVKLAGAGLALFALMVIARRRRST